MGALTRVVKLSGNVFLYNAATLHLGPPTMNIDNVKGTL